MTRLIHFTAKKFRILAAVIALAAATAGATHAQDAAPYTLAGKTIRVVLPQSAGGNFDAQTRLLVDYMERYLPGHPSVVVQNLPGASGARMMQYIAELDPAQDLVMYTINGSMPFRAVIGELTPDLFDPRNVNWVGAFRGNTWYCVVSATGGIETVDDLREGELLFGAASVTSTSATIYAMLTEQLGFAITTVAGYDSLGAMLLAIERGELDGLCNNYSGFEALMGPAVAAGDIRFLFYFGDGPRDDIPGAPYLGELVPPEMMSFVDAASAAILFGGPYAIPAGSDPQFVAAMREAFAAVMADPDFRAAADAYGVDVHYETPDAIVAKVDALFALPPEVIERIGQYFGGE